VVALIPPGKVASYGQIAQLAGLPNRARLVGRTLSQLPADTKLPWHRVVNASLRLSLAGSARKRQRARLEHEGVNFTAERIAPGCRWEP
jgi:methylated-DNA-protein-cysteine methyltransferase-like protein